MPLHAPVTHTDGPLAKDKVGLFKVVEFDVKFDGIERNPILQKQLLAALNKNVARCDGDGDAVKLTVIVEGYAGMSATSVLLGGGAMGISGFVQFRHSVSNDLFAEFYVDQSIAYAGLIEIVVAAEEIDKLATNYAKKICKGIFTHSS